MRNLAFKVTEIHTNLDSDWADLVLWCGVVELELMTL